MRSRAAERVPAAAGPGETTNAAESAPEHPSGHPSAGEAGRWHGQAVVVGKPASQGSKRIARFRGKGKPIVVDDDPRLKSWREAMVLSMRQCRPPAPLDGPLRLALSIFARRPLRHYRAGGTLRPDAPYWATAAPDVDKVLRACFDAAQSAGWVTNDARFALVFVSRVYVGRPEEERVVVDCQELERPGGGPPGQMEEQQ